MALILSVFNRKGGQGKSTTSLLFGGMFASHGKRVAIVDKDAQHTVTTWAGLADRNGERPFDVVDGENENLQALTARLAKDYDVVIIDTPGGKYDEALPGELVVVPTLVDFDSYAGTVGAVAELERKYPGKYRTFVFANRVELDAADHVALLTRSFAEQPFLRQRRAFPKAFLRGTTVYSDKPGVPNAGLARDEFDRVAEAFGAFVKSKARTNHNAAPSAPAATVEA